MLKMLWSESISFSNNPLLMKSFYKAQKDKDGSDRVTRYSNPKSVVIFPAPLSRGRGVGGEDCLQIK